MFVRLTTESSIKKLVVLHRHVQCLSQLVKHNLRYLQHYALRFQHPRRDSMEHCIGTFTNSDNKVCRVE
jgi:hypothetical protein